MAAKIPVNPAPENPFEYLTQERICEKFGFGERSLRALVAMPGFPIVAKKINPIHMHQWLWEQREQIGKLVE